MGERQKRYMETDGSCRSGKRTAGMVSRGFARGVRARASGDREVEGKRTVHESIVDFFLAFRLRDSKELFRCGLYFLLADRYSGECPPFREDVASRCRGVREVRILVQLPSRVERAWSAYLPDFRDISPGAAFFQEMGRIAPPDVALLYPAFRAGWRVREITFVYRDHPRATDGRYPFWPRKANRGCG